MAKNSNKTAKIAKTARIVVRRNMTNDEERAILRAFTVQNNRVARVGKLVARRDIKLIARLTSRLTVLLNAMEDAAS
jgi:hypothetical protein